MPVGTADPVRAMKAADRLPVIMQSLTAAYDVVVVECGASDAEGIRRLVADGTEIMVSVIEPDDETAATAAALKARGYGRVMLVSPADHGRRMRRCRDGRQPDQSSPDRSSLGCGWPAAFLRSSLVELPDRRAVLDPGLDAGLEPQAAGKQRALGGQRHDDVEMPGFDIAPQPLVGLVADAEIVDFEPLAAGLADVLEEQEVAGAGMPQIVLRDRAEFADEALGRQARPGDGAQRAADFQRMQHERRRVFAQAHRRNSERKKVCTSASPNTLAMPILRKRNSFMAKKASSSRRTSSGVCASMRRKPPAASNLRVCERCFLRLRLPLTRDSSASKPPSRLTASERLGLEKCGSASSGFGSPSRSGSSRSSTSTSTSGRARRIAANDGVGARNAPAARKAGSAAGKLPLAWRPLMKRGDAERAGSDDFQRQRIDRLAVRLDHRDETVGRRVGDPFLDPQRALRRRAKRRARPARYRRQDRSAGRMDTEAPVRTASSRPRGRGRDIRLIGCEMTWPRQPSFNP